MLKNVMKLATTMIAVAALSALALGLTADEIYDLMDAEADALAEGSMVSTIRFENAYGDGTTASNLFGSLGKPDKSLIYFIEPADVGGTIFLTLDDPEGVEDARLWLYLPVIGIAKELVSEDERGGSFAGSSLSYEDLGDQDRRNDYDAVLIGEETLSIGDLTRTAHVIEATAKPDADVDTLRTVVWIDTEFYIMLKMEGYNDLGNLESTMEVQGLVEFEGKLTPSVMLATNVSEESSTLITIADRHRPDGEIPDDVFDAANLGAFDPTEWGF